MIDREKYLRGALILFASILFFVASAPSALAQPAAECSPPNLKDGDFETPDILGMGLGTFETYSGPTAFGSWTVESGSSIDVLHDHVDLDGLWKNADGHQSIDLEGITAGKIYQDVGVTPGTTYKLRFAVSANPDHTPGLIKTMNVWWEGAKIATISAEVKPRPEMVYDYYTYSVTATGSTARLAFESADFPVSTYGNSLDGISLTCPEVGLVPCGGEGQPACNLCHIFQLIKNILDIFLFPIVPIVAALLIAIGGFFLFAAAGNPPNLGKAKTIIFAAIIGLLIIYGSWVFINLLLTSMGVAGWTGLGTWWEIECGVPASAPPPIAHWNFNDGSGTTINDAAGSNNGTLTLGSGGNTSVSAAWVAGKNGGPGTAVHFDGVDDYVDIASATGLRYEDSNQFTVAGWIFWDGGTNDPSIDRQYIWDSGHLSTPSPYYVVVVDGPAFLASPVSIRAIGPRSTDPTEVRAGTPISANTWHHFAAIFDKSSQEIRLHLNGGLPTTVSWTPVGGNSILLPTIGDFRGNALDYYWNGLIDDVKIWNTALTSQQVQAEFAAGP